VNFSREPVISVDPRHFQGQSSVGGKPPGIKMKLGGGTMLLKSERRRGEVCYTAGLCDYHDFS
jgi:hypothetical protein